MVGLLGIPFDANSSFLRGAGFAPEKIREAFRSDSSNTYAESGLDIEGAFQDFGDLKFTGDGFFDIIEQGVAEALQKQPRLLCLGGDHSVSFPIVSAVAKKYNGLNILHLDAHADLYHDFEDNPFSHASPFARIMESLPVKRLVQVGIRTLNTHQREQARKFGVEIIEMKDFKSNIKLQFDGPVYLSLDLDVMDPAFVPGVSHHEPGGMSTREVIQIIQSLQGNLIAADIVEYNPLRDAQQVTAMVAAKLLKEIISKMSE